MSLVVLENKLVGVPSKQPDGDGSDEARPAGNPRDAFDYAEELVNRGYAVTLLPADKYLTSDQAAGLLNVSRDYLIAVLQRDEIRHEKDELDWWVRAGDLIAYQRRRDEETNEALRRLSELSEDR